MLVVTSFEGFMHMLYLNLVSFNCHKVLGDSQNCGRVMEPV